uniref:Glycosyltransferase family 92 protein n=1 Tax=Strongyloides stercoralis TaxID=6248 RepID=A0A0K0DYR4_STRER
MKHGYDLNLVSEQSYFETKKYCPHYDFNFKKFCIISEILRLSSFTNKYDYVLMLDENVIVVDYNIKLESFIPNNPNTHMQLFNNPQTLEFEKNIIFFKPTVLTLTFIANIADYFYMINSNSKYLLNIDSAIWYSIIEFFDKLSNHHNDNRSLNLLRLLKICINELSNFEKYYFYSIEKIKFTHLICLKQMFLNIYNKRKTQFVLYKYIKYIKINESLTLSNFFKCIETVFPIHKSENKLLKPFFKYNEYFYNSLKLYLKFNFIKEEKKENIKNIFYQKNFFDNNKSINLINYQYKIYMKSAFLISNKSIRLSLLKNIDDNSQLYYRLPYTLKISKNYNKIKLNCQSGSCIEKGLNCCTTIGYVGEIYNKNLLFYLKDKKKIFITKDILKMNDIEVPLIDSRINMINNDQILYKHTLGICVQPMYLYFDYPTIIRFFENWILEGVTKFYIYYQSILDKIIEIINAYKLETNIDIEVIYWSKIPYNAKNDDINPNTKIYRLEAPLAIYDCMQRARNNIKYVISADLDEIIHVNENIENGNLIALLEKESKNYPNSALFSFQSRRGYLPMNWGIGHPKNINFSIFSNLVMDEDVFERPLYQKNIYRPERVVSYQIHLIRTLERNPLTNKRYSFTLIPPSSAFIFHLRRYKDYFFYNSKQVRSTILKKKSQQWNKNFKDRFNKFNFTNNGWLTNIHYIGLELENCRKRVARTMGKIICQSIEVCEKKLKTINSNRLIKTNNSWIII